ncbi:MAG TPA: MarR family transcriptional regulator [Terriglobales bacterium]|nr:MarR family transcriptional regulator [Terriglobales bacterium]
MPRFQGTEEQERALGAFVKLLRAGNAVTAAAMRSLADSGLTPTQFAVLEALYHAAGPKPMCLSDVAHKILTSSGNLTLVVKNLEKRGLVRRKLSGKDRRFVELEITARGGKIISDVFPAHAAEIVGVMSRLSPAEQETLAGLCRKLGAAETSRQ